MSMEGVGEAGTIRSFDADTAVGRLAHALLSYTLSADGQSHLVIKGPTSEGLLFEVGEHQFADVDVLVAPGGADAAVAALTAIGYADTTASRRPGEFDDHSRPLRRTSGPGNEVDVHFNYP